MRILQGFLIVIAAAALWMLSPSEMAYDFQTDVRSDTFVANTAPADTSAAVVLWESLYNNDLTTISFTSNVSSDAPVANSYNSTTKSLLVTGLTSNQSRSLLVNYDVDALNTSTALSNVISNTPLMWLLIIIALPIAGLGAIITEIWQRSTRRRTP